MCKVGTCLSCNSCLLQGDDEYVREGGAVH
uniref:Uncharacterized protein n=1 Tax=Physcomitrium patens TaxID=3218 RepID=A0A2K1KQM4_PHYPA|nr:hypothetical protein PHYPA_006965 [Physcomitrium patens]